MKWEPGNNLPTGDIPFDAATCEDRRNAYWLIADNAGLAELPNLEGFENLEIASFTSSPPPPDARKVGGASFGYCDCGRSGAANSIIDIQPLLVCSSLKELNAGGNLISDIAPLLELPNLEFVELYGNPLSERSISEYIPALRRRGVVVSLEGYGIMLDWRDRPGDESLDSESDSTPTP